MGDIPKAIKAMSKLEIVPMGHKIKSKGIYNLEDLYGELQLWFTHMGYKWHEVEYKKIGRPGGSYRLELIWIGTKKIDDYSNFVIKVILGADVSDVEVTLDGGQKVGRQKATLEFRSGAWIERNAAFFLNGLFGGVAKAKLYEFLIRGRLHSQEAELWGHANKLYDELKAFMMLSTASPSAS